MILVDYLLGRPWLLLKYVKPAHEFIGLQECSGMGWMETGFFFRNHVSDAYALGVFVFSLLFMFFICL